MKVQFMIHLVSCFVCVGWVGGGGEGELECGSQSHLLLLNNDSLIQLHLLDTEVGERETDGQVDV